MVNITIDGLSVEVARGTLLIRAAEKAGVRIPRFCDHPLLALSANCRQCLVEVAMIGTRRPATAVRRRVPPKMETAIAMARMAPMTWGVQESEYQE